MKKTYKILVLLLSLCLIIGAMVMVVSAEDETATEESTFDLAAAISAASAGDTITMTGNATITSSITINKTLTIDLSGYTLTTNLASTSPAFNITAQNSTFTICGHGNIESTGMLINLSLSGNAHIANVNINGTNGDINVHETGADGAALISAEKGTCDFTFTNVNFTIDKMITTGVITATTSSATFLKFIFNSCEISATGTNPSKSTECVIFLGKNSKAELNNTIITTDATAIRTYTNDCTGDRTDPTLKISSSEIKVQSTVSNSAVIGCSSSKPKGTILIEDSYIEASCYFFYLDSSANSNTTYPNMALFCENTELYHNNNKSGGRISRAIATYFDENCVLTSKTASYNTTQLIPYQSALGTLTNKTAAIYVEPGFKTNMTALTTLTSENLGLLNASDSVGVADEASLYEFVAGDDGYYTVTLKGSEPEVSFDLKAAIDAAASGDTITLPEDTTVDLTAIEGNTITINKNLTIDLGGYTLGFIPNGTGPAFTINTASITLNITGSGTIDLNGGKLVADTDNATAATKINITGTQANPIVITSNCENTTVLFVARKAEYTFSYVNITVAATSKNGTFQENGTYGGKFTLNNCEISATGAQDSESCIVRAGGPTGTLELNNTTVTTDGIFIKLNKASYAGGTDNPFIKISNSEIVCTNTSLNSSIIGVAGVTDSGAMSGTILIEGSTLKAAYSFFDIDVSSAYTANTKVVCNGTDFHCEGDTFAYISNACPVYLDENCTITGTTANAAAVASNSTNATYGIFASAGIRIGLEIFATGTSENGLRDTDGEIINSEASLYEFVNDSEGNAALPYVISLKEGTTPPEEPDPEPEVFDLAAAIAAASSGDTITMTGDATIASTITIDKTITIDLAGYTITSTISDTTPAFNLTKTNAKFTICGKGNIETAGMLIQLNLSYGSAEADININGTDGDINIHTTGAANATLVSDKQGTCDFTFTNVNFTIDKKITTGVFTATTSTNATYAKFIFNSCEISATGTNPASNHCIIFLGYNSTAEINDTIITSDSTAIRIFSNNYSGGEDAPLLKISNSEIRVQSTVSNSAVIGCASSKPKGTILIEDSYLEASCYFFYTVSKDFSYETYPNMGIFCKNTELYHNNTAEGYLTRSTATYLDANCVLTSKAETYNSILLYDTVGTENAVFVEPGFKTNNTKLIARTAASKGFLNISDRVGVADEASLYEFVAGDDGYYTVTVKEGVLIISGVKANVAVYSDFGVNIYIPAEYQLTNISANGDEYEMTDTQVNGAIYTKISITRKMYHASENVSLTFTATCEDKVRENYTLTINVVSYAKAVLKTYASDSLEASLMHHILNYAQAANIYYENKVEGVSPNNEIDEIINGASFNYYTYTLDIKSNTGDQATALENADINCQLDIDNETLGYIFTINSDEYKDKVSIILDGQVYIPVDGVITISGLKVYNLVKDITINIDGVQCSYHLANIIDYYATNGYAAEAALVEAFYEYAKCAANYKTSTKENNAQVLNNKRVIFIGNSHTFYGKTVIEKDKSIVDLESRENDNGYFYQLCKENGVNVEVTNWTFGNHGLSDLFNDNGAVADNHDANRGCNDVDHKAVLAAGNSYYDYVVIQPGTGANTTLVSQVETVMSFFKEANPNAKFILVLTNRHYVNGNDATMLPLVATLEEMGVLIADWGRLTYDIINGAVSVPGTETVYNQNSFIVSKSADDGYHPNMLTGYITSLWIYSVITGESASCQPYFFATDTTVNSKFNAASYKSTYYTHGEDETATYDITTNFDEILADGNEIGGLQQLIDLYIAEAAYRDAAETP